MTDAERIANMTAALRSIRRAAASSRQFTNRLQFIYARAGVGLDGGEWDEGWKAENGFDIREHAIVDRDELRAFALAVMEAWPHGDLDGDVLDALAKRHHLIVPTKRTEPCGEECNCTNYGHTPEDWAAGVECYRYTPRLTGRDSE